MFGERAIHSAYCACFRGCLSICVCASYPFGFEGEKWDSIVFILSWSLPVYLLSGTMQTGVFKPALYMKNEFHIMGWRPVLIVLVLPLFISFSFFSNVMQRICATVSSWDLFTFLCPRGDSQGRALRFAPVRPSVCPSVVTFYGIEFV